MEILSSNENIKVTLLAELLEVSQVTLRRDLLKLYKYGIACCSHGYVSLSGANEISRRFAFFHLIKRKIAKAASQIVGDNETVMIGSGSCCALLAEELVLARKNVTIITNSAFILKYISGLPDIKVIFLGGFYQPKTQITIGSITINNAENFYLDKYFFGTNGYIQGYGFTGGDHLCVDSVVSLSKCAKKVYVLTEAAKFSRCGAFNMVRLDKITGVFTDSKIPKEAEAELRNNNVQLYKVSVLEENIKWRKISGLPPFLYTEKEERINELNKEYRIV